MPAHPINNYPTQYPQYPIPYPQNTDWMSAQAHLPAMGSPATGILDEAALAAQAVPVSAQASSVPAPTDGLPPGWTQHADPAQNNAPFYCCRSTGATQWTRPV